MSIVNLKNVKVYATFSKGFRVVEESTGKDGQTYKQRWTVWADAMESGKIREGDIVSVSGFLGAKVNDWEDKDHVQRHSVELSINSPRIEAATETPAVESAADVWNAPAANDMETPF